MEFVAGAVIAIGSFLISNFIINRNKNNNSLKINLRQSSTFELIGPALRIILSVKNKKDTQASQYSDKSKLKVLMMEDKAYWIQDNTVFEASIIDGSVDQENVKVVDTMGMNKVELDRLSYIVDRLTKGDNNDRGYPGYQKF